MGEIIGGIIVGLTLVCLYYVFLSIRNSDEYPNNKIKFSRNIAIALFTVPVVIMTFAACTTQVDTGEIAVMTRFGKVTGQELGEGFHFKSPLEVANKYDVKILKKETEAAAASKDLQDVQANIVINYSLEAGKVSQIHKTIGKLYEEKLIDNSIQETVKASTAKFDATEMITNRPALKEEAFNILYNRLVKYGIIVRELSITNLTFSNEFTRAIEQKQVAQQEAQKAVYIAEKAKQEAQAEIEKARGQAEAQRLLTTTASTQSIELKRLEVQSQAISKWDGKLPTTSLGADSNILLQIK